VNAPEDGGFEQRSVPAERKVSSLVFVAADEFETIRFLVAVHVKFFEEWCIGYFVQPGEEGLHVTVGADVEIEFPPVGYLRLDEIKDLRQIIL
jgi:hypothetical protein